MPTTWTPQVSKQTTSTLTASIYVGLLLDCVEAKEKK